MELLGVLHLNGGLVLARPQISALNRIQLGIVDVRDGLGDEGPNHVVLVVQEVRLVVEVQSFLQVEHQVVSVAEGD